MRIRHRILFLFLLACTSPAVHAQTQSDWGYTDDDNNISSMLESCQDAMVTIEISKTGLGTESFGFGGKQNKKYLEQLKFGFDETFITGSGFLIRHNDGLYVVTNAHVVHEAAGNRITVRGLNGEAATARLIGGDSFYDLAVLELKWNKTTKNWDYMRFNTEQARIGQQVWAIGNPLGKFPFSISDGIISAVNRTREGIIGRFGYLQTTATLIWGSSGGALVDKNGLVIGVNSQIQIESRNGQQFIQPQINFALEGRIAHRVVKDVIENNGMVRRSYLGVEFVVEQPRDGQENSFFSRKAPKLSRLMPDCPFSEELGPHIGKHVIQLNDAPIKGIDDLLAILEETKPGEALNFWFANAGLDGSLSAGVFRFLEKQENSKWPKKAPDLTIYTKELQASNMESLSRTILGSDSDTLVQSYGCMHYHTPGGQYQLTGAGYYRSEQQKLLFRVDELTDIATALRLNGPSGQISLECLGENDQRMIIQMDFATDESGERIRRLLWY